MAALLAGLLAPGLGIPDDGMGIDVLGEFSPVVAATTFMAVLHCCCCCGCFGIADLAGILRIAVGLVCPDLRSERLSDRLVDMDDEPLRRLNVGDERRLEPLDCGGGTCCT